MTSPISNFKITLSFIICIFCSTANAQKSTESGSANRTFYKTGFGVRVGGDGGLTIKHFIKSNRAIEGILSRSWGYGGARLTGLYEVQKSIKDFKRVSWYYGIGAHVAFYNAGYYGYRPYNGGYYDNKGKWHSTSYKNNYSSFGVDAILGLEYQFLEIPFTLGIDIKPYFDFTETNNRFWDAAISIRYVLN